MATFIFFAVFAVIAIALLAIAFRANRRKHAGQSGMELAHYRQSQYPRGRSLTT